MIQFNSQNTFKEIHYDSHDIKYVYGGCSGDLVWEKDTPPVPPVFDGKYLVVYADSSTVSAECSSTADTIIIGEITKTLATGITVGNCVTSIGDNAFQGFLSLKTVILPDSITTIGNGAFYDSRRLESVTIYATTPPTLGDSIVFGKTNDCPIYVPAESVSTYKSASGWSTYANRIQTIP